jgi:hypothetical protein
MRTEFTFCNSGNEVIELWIEPWGDLMKIPVNLKCLIEIISNEGSCVRPEIEFENALIRLYVWGNVVDYKWRLI